MGRWDRESVARLAGYFKALSHPCRLRMFIGLLTRHASSNQDPKVPESGTSVGELARIYGKAAPSASHCLKELHQSGLIRMNRHGREVHCSIEPRALQALACLLAAKNLHSFAKKQVQPVNPSLSEL